MSASYWLEALDQAGYRAMCYLLAALWQSSILLVATAGLAWLLRRRAAVRHALWMLALTVAPLLPLLTSAARQVGAPQAPLVLMPAYEAPARAALAPLGRPAIHESALPPAGLAPDPTVQSAPVQPPAHAASFADNITRHPWSLAFLAYSAGLIACLSLVVIGRLHIRQWVRSGRTAADDRLERAFAQASALLKTRGPFEVLICRRAPAPLSLGLRRPRILLPDGLIARLTEEELLAVALHELAHVRRRDPLLLTLATLVRAVLFFHPLVWLAVRQVSALAELCADDAVLEATGAPLPYAKLLARLAEELPPRPLSTEMATGLLFSRGAFLRRVEAILGDRSRIRRLSRLALWSTLAAVAISICLAIVLPMDSKKAFHVSGDPLDVRLVGIAPDGEDLLFSPEGKPLGPWRAGRGSREVWSAEEFRRDYVFQLPQTSEPVTYLPPIIRPVGSELFYPAQGFLGQTRRWEGGTTVSLCSFIVLDKRFLFPFGRSYYGRHIPTHVDITFRFYQGRRGPATGRFTAPFAYDRVQKDPNQPDCGLTIRKETGRGQRGEGLTFEIKAIMRDGREAARLVWEGLEAALFVYDRQGEAHWADYRGGGLRGGGRGGEEIHGKYFLKGIELEDVQSVVFNEQPRTKVFHNVAATFPSAPERHHMAYLDVMAARLGLPASDPESVRQYQFKSVQEAIRVLDCLRDYSRLYQVHSRFFVSDLKPESFSREELEKLRVAAWEIVKSSDPSARVFGVAIGLWGCWPEFASPAIEMVQGNDFNRDVVVRALFLYREHLTDAQLAQVTEILLQRDDPRTSGELRTLLLRSAGRPSVVQALRHLAESDKPWLWMPALDGYQLGRLQKAGPLSEKIQLRVVATGLGAQIPDADRLAPQAYALLPPLLTPQFLQIDLSSFSQALKLVTQNLDRPAATVLFIRFLERQLKEWHTWQVDGRSTENWWAVDRIVKYLNLWHGTNLGGLGSNVSEETFNNSSYDWQAVARQAIEWARTGNDASQLPVAWSPKAGALRIVWRNLRDPELSAIGVWDRPLETAESPAWTPMELAGDFLNYKIGRDDTAGSATLVFDTWAGFIKGHFVSSLIRFTPSQLPLEVTPPLQTGMFGTDSGGNQHQTPLWRGSWEVWLEPAQSPQSVLVGSALFGLWSAKYLAGGPLGAPEPKVFARQPRDQVRRYVLERRSFEGWSEAEIALRHAMDQDAGFVSEDLRPFTEGLSRDGAARAWREFLGYPDLTPEMKIFGWWRVGSLCATNMGPDDKPDFAAAESAFAQARAVDPELVSNETINATTNWASLPGPPQDRARRLAEAHAWLTTRTDAMLERGARRPFIRNWPDLAPVRNMSKAPAEDIARAVKQLRAGLETGLNVFQANLPGWTEHIRREDPAAAQKLDEAIRQAGQPESIKQNYVRDESKSPTKNADPLTTNTLADLAATLELNKDSGVQRAAATAIQQINEERTSRTQEEGYKAGGEVVNGLQVSIEPQKKSYGLDEPILVHWRIQNVGNKAQTILWHQEQQHLPVAFRYGKKGEKQTIRHNMLASLTDRLPGPPEKLLLQPGQTKEAILDLRQFSMGLVEKDNKNLGMYKVAGLYTLKDTSSIISSYLAQPEYRDIFADTVVSGDIAIELTDDLSWLKAQLSCGDVFKSIEAARHLAPLTGNEAVLVELEKMYPTDNTRHMLRLVDVMAELGERSHVAEVLDMVEAGGYTPHLIDYGEDLLDFLLRWGEKRGMEYLQRYLIKRPTVGYTNALERDRSELLRKITDIKTVKQSYLPLLIISLNDRDTPTPNAAERWCDKAGLAIQKLLGRDWGLGLEQTVEERDGIIGRMRAELAGRVPALAERKQRVRFVERADGDEGGGYSNGLRFVANPVKRAVKQGEDVAFDLFVVNSGEPYKLFCIYPDTDWRWTSVVLQTSIGKRVEMTPPEPKAALRPIEKEDFIAIPPEKTIYLGRQTISQDWILPGGLPPGEHTFFVSLDKTGKMETTIPGYKEFCEKRFLHPWNGTPIAMTRSVTVVYDEKRAGAACWLEGSCTNKFPMHGRWNISRAKPVAVVVGWYAFDESGLVDHGGIATQTAASAVPLDLLFGARLYEGGLTLETGLNRIEKESDAGWPEPGRSASASDDIAVPSAPVLRTANPALKTTSLDALTSFGETLRPLWKVEIPRGGKSKLTLVYAVRALPEDAPVRLFDPDNPAEALRVGRDWSGLRPILYPPAKAKLDSLADLPEFHGPDTAAAPWAGGPPSDGVHLGASDNQPLALGLAPTLELNKPTYDIGEPIIASLVIKNVSGRAISLETGSDYRSGRAERFRFRVTDDKGKAVPDPLKIFVSQNMAGGLIGGVDLAPGETYTVTALLNLYASPRAPGRYTVSGDYQLTQRMDDATSGRLTLRPVTFSVRNGSSRMSQEQGRALFSKYKLDGIHPCILYGLQNSTRRIPQLIAMMEPKTPTAREDPFAPPAERNASFDAMESLVLMPDKAAVYRALEKEIAARWPDSSSKYDYLFLPLGHIYRTAITPESVPIIEPSLDHASAAVADLAFLTALSMGSAKALNRLPAALRSTDSSKRQFARENAFQYLNRGLGSPGYAIEGIPTELVPKYGDALMEGFRKEEGDPARADAEVFPAILLSGYLLEFHFAHHRLWDAIGIAVESNSPLKHTAALRYLAKCGENTAFPPLEKDQIARLIPFARRQTQTHPDARARALAMRCLGLWGDTESIPALAQALDAPEKPLRLAAAEALILLHHDPLLEKCIERLVEEDEARDPKHVIWVAQRLGMKNAGQSFQLRLPGSKISLAGGTGVMSAIRPDSTGSAVATPSVQETRDRWKATLRHLTQGSYQQAQNTSSVKNADHATPDSLKPDGQLEWYEHETPTGVVARRVERNAEGKSIQVIFYVSDIERLARDFGKKTPDGGVTIPGYQDWGAHPEQYLMPRQIVRTQYDAQGRKQRDEYYDSAMDHKKTIEYQYDASGHETKRIERNPQGTRELERRWTPNAEILFDETGERVMAVSGTLPGDCDLANGWGPDAKGLSCGIAVGPQSIPAGYLLSSLPALPARQDPYVYLTIRNQTDKPLKFNMPLATQVEFELKDAQGRVIPYSLSKDTEEMRRREEGIDGAGGQPTLAPGQALYQRYRLLDWYRDLPSGNYTLKVIRLLTAKGPRLVSNSIHFVSNEGPLNSQHSDSSTSITRLISVMTDRNRDWNKERIPAQDALARMGALAVPKLIELLKFDPNESPPDSQHAAPFGFEKAYMACRTLAKIGPAAEPAIPHLAPLLTDHDIGHVMAGEYLSFAAMEALGAIGKASIPALRPYLKNEDLHTRVFALYAINQMKGDTSDAIPDVLPLLKDSLPAVRASAAESLGRMGPKAQSAIPYLEPLLQDTAVDDSVFQMGTVKDHAVKAIKRIQGADPEYSGDERLAASLRGLRAVAVAMEGHRIDNNAYPKTLYQLTTPVAYLSALPEDPFATSDTQKLIQWKPDAKPAPLLYSIGPDRMDQGGDIVYDPTNGATSPGDIVRTLNPGEAKSYDEIHGAALGKEIQQDAPIEDLIKALESDNINQWSRATDFLAIRKAESKPAVPALVRALGDPQKRESALYPLREMGPAAAEAAPALIRGLGEWKDHHAARWGAAVALANIGEAAAPALEEAAKSPDPIVSVWAHAALARNEVPPPYDPAKGTRSLSLLSPYDYYELVNPEYLPHLHAVGKHMASQDKRIASEALSAVQMIGPKAAPLTPMLLGILKLDNPRLPKNELVRAMAIIGPGARDALSQIIPFLTSPHADTRRQAISAVRMIGGPEAKAAVPGLVESLRMRTSPDAMTASLLPVIREEAADALETIGPAAKDAMPALIEAMSDPEDKVRAGVVRAIGSIDPASPEALPKLIQAMEDPYFGVQYAVNEVLVAVGPVSIEVIRAFIQAVRRNGQSFGSSGDYSGPSAHIVPTSQAFFSQLGPEHRYAVPDLADLARDSHPGVQRLAFQALANIGEVPADLMPTLIASAQENEGYWASGVLQRLGPKAAPAAPAMIRLLKEGNSSQRLTAIEVLGAIGLPAVKEAIPILTQMIQENSKPEHLNRTACETLLKLDPASAAALDGLEKLLANPKTSASDTLYVHSLLLRHGRNPQLHLRALQEVLNGKDTENSAIAGRMILRVRKEPEIRKTALEKIVQLVQGPDNRTKEQAAAAFLHLVPSDAAIVPQLVPQLLAIVNQPIKTEGDRTRYGLRYAVKGLGKLGPAARAALPSLKELPRTCESYEWHIRKAAAEAVRKIEEATLTQSGNP